MAFFLTIDQLNPEPIYKQIVDSVRAQVAHETLKPGDILPSVRELAKSLNINVNTVNRAYQMLKDMNVVTIRPARGAIIAAEGKKALGSEKNKEILLEHLKRFLEEAHRLGFEKNEVVQLMRSK